MTVKELAVFTGKEERTIRRWVNKASDKMSAIKDKMSVSSSSRPAFFTIDEVECILVSGSMSKDAVSILMENAKNQERKELEPPSPDVNEMMKFMALILEKQSSMQEQQNRFFESFFNRIGAFIDNSTPVARNQLSAPTKSNRKYLNQLVREYAQEKLNGDYRKAWNNLYKDFYYRLDLKIKTEADHWGCSPIEYLEKTDHLEDAIAIVIELMGE